MRNMPRKNDTKSNTSPVDLYRKQLGRQEKKVVHERRREMKRLAADKETVSYWKVRTSWKRSFQTVYSRLQGILWSFAAVLFMGIITYSFLMYYLAPKD